MKFFHINNNLCTSCGRCGEMCPTQAIVIDAGRRLVDTDRCTSCGNCVKSCEEGAVSVETIEHLILEIERSEEYRSRLGRLESELTQLKAQLTDLQTLFADTAARLPVAMLIADRAGTVAASNALMLDALGLDPITAGGINPGLVGENIRELFPDGILKLIRVVSSSADSSRVITLGGKKRLMTAYLLEKGHTLVALSDLSDPGVVSTQIAGTLRETIDKKMAMVQQIGTLLGEEVSGFVERLNTVIDMVEATGQGENGDGR